MAMLPPTNDFCGFPTAATIRVQHETISLHTVYEDVHFNFGGASATYCMYVLGPFTEKRGGGKMYVRDKKDITRYYATVSDFRFNREYANPPATLNYVYVTAYFFGKYIITRSVIATRHAYTNLHSYVQWDILNNVSGTYHTISQIMYYNKDYILKALRNGRLHIKSSLDRQHLNVWYEV